MGYTWPHYLVFPWSLSDVRCGRCCFQFLYTHVHVKSHNFPLDFLFLFMMILEYSWISHMSSHCGGVLCPRWNLLGPYMSCAPCPPKPKSQHTKSLKGVCPSQYPMVERCWEWSTRHVWKWSHGWKTIQFSWSKVIPLWFLFWCFTVSYIELVYYGIWFVCAPSLMLNRLPLSILFDRNCTHSTEDMQYDSNDWSMVEQIHVCAGLYYGLYCHVCVSVFASFCLRKESPKLQEAVPMSPMPMPGKGKAPQMYNQSAWLIGSWTAQRHSFKIKDIIWEYIYLQNIYTIYI